MGLEAVQSLRYYRNFIEVEMKRRCDNSFSE